MAAKKKSRARILFALPALCLGGSQRVLVNVLNHIETSRFEPHVAVLKGSERWLETPYGVQVHELGARRARHASLSLAKLCWKLRPQTVLSTSAHLNSALIGARPFFPSGTRLVVREGADITSSQVGLGHVRTLLYKHAYRRADSVICQSDHMRETLIREFGLAPNKVVRIYNPVDFKLIERLAAGPNPFLKSGINLVSAGRLSHEKGVDLLLQAMPRVLQAVPNAILTLVGEGPDLPLLQAVTRILGIESSVNFVGAQHNPYPYLKHADLVVLPSRTEAFPNVVLESMVVGTPVVATNCTGALPEISSSTRQLRVTKGISSEELASSILSMIGDSLNRQKFVPGAEFEARFGVNAITREYERVLGNGMHKGPAGVPQPINLRA